MLDVLCHMMPALLCFSRSCLLFRALCSALLVVIMFFFGGGVDG
jgi:hypothetical protein